MPNSPVTQAQLAAEIDRVIAANRHDHDQLRSDVTTAIKDHETRLRALERWRNVLVGAGIGVGLLLRYGIQIAQQTLGGRPHQ